MIKIKSDGQRKGKKGPLFSLSEEDNEQPVKIQPVAFSVTPKERHVISSSKKKVVIKMEPANPPFTAKHQGPGDKICIYSNSSSTGKEVYIPKSPPALPETFYTPCITRRLRAPKPTPPAKKAKRRFSSEEEKAIVESAAETWTSSRHFHIPASACAMSKTGKDNC